MSSRTHEFFQEGEEGRYAGGPADVAAQQAAMEAMDMEGPSLHPHTSLPPGVLDERRQKFSKIVLGVVGVSAVVVLAGTLMSNRGSGGSSESATSDGDTSAEMPSPVPETEPTGPETDAPEEPPPPPPEEEEDLQDEDEPEAVEADAVETTGPAPQAKPGATSTPSPTPRPSAAPSPDPAPAPSPAATPAPAASPSPQASPQTTSTTRAVERAKATRRPSDNPPSAGFPSP